MGRATTLSLIEPSTADVPAGPVLCDQAVFTSVRSGMGEGYRLIASSAGVQAQEKVEITRRSPSHGSLCQDDPDAVGLVSYRMPNGRHCVAFCCHAGCEQTARGGLRVYTHVAIFDRQAWPIFQANPVPVHAAIFRYIENTGRILKPAAKLDKIPLTPPVPVSGLPGAAQGYGSDMLEAALAAATDILAGRNLILRNASHPLRMLEKMLLSLPLEVREMLDVSVGVKFSPARRMRLVFTEEPERELQRRIAGLHIQMRDIEHTSRQVSTDFIGWEHLLRRWWREGRRQDILRLTTELCRGTTCDALDRVAAICEASDSLPTLSADAVRMLISRYGSARLSTKAEQVLAGELLEKANRRLAGL
jgi:hypothetical protein